MKLRDKQNKMEKALSFYGTSKGGLFQETGTRVKGEVDLLGALVLVDNLDSDELGRAGIRTGIMSRITFETPVGQKDTAVMEIVTNQQNEVHFDDISGSAISIAKIGYIANVTEWLGVKKTRCPKTIIPACHTHTYTPSNFFSLYIPHLEGSSFILNLTISSR